MKQYTLVLLAFLLSFSTAQAEGIEFFKGTWAEALQEAKKQDKLIFVDAYTSWCGPCKMMTRSVFPTKEVGDYYNANFINMKLDMEKDSDGRLVKGQYAVQSFPTFLYVDGNEKIAHRAVGAKKPAEFVQLGEMVMRKWDKSADMKELYDKGNRDPEFLLKYVTALNKSNKPSLKIANEYLKEQTDLTTPINLHFILESTIESDSKIFGLLLENRAKIAGLTSEQKVNEYIARACKNTVKKAIEFESEDLFKEAKSNAKNVTDATIAQNFEAEADMDFYKATNNSKKYLKAASSFLKDKDADTHFKVVSDIMKSMPKDAKAVAKAEDWAAAGAKKGNSAKHYLSYAMLLFENGKAKNALSMAEKALELGGDEKEVSAIAEKLIAQIKLSEGS